MKKSFVEELEDVERIGDRDVRFNRHFDENGNHWTEYGDGPGYVYNSSREGRWWVRFDYRKAVIAKELSHRTKGKWEKYFSNVEALHTLLANDPAHRVAGSLRGSVYAIRQAVIHAVRTLDSAPLLSIAAAIDAVRWVEEREQHNDLMLLAISKAANRHNSIPTRAEIREFLSKKDQELPANALKSRLATLGFDWLPGGRSRKVDAKKVQSRKKLN
jgi:hypothetical protein